ncbi:MAG: CcrColossus [Rhodospirillales bacterium]|nr:CcrColossus [Rhodospirillales bacterium]
MKQITQTKMYRPKGHPEGQQYGNCQRAAMASIFDMDIEDLPHFEEVRGAGDFWHGIYDWLESWGFGYEWHDPEAPPTGYSIATGPAARGVSHAVVALDGKIVWDPHPSRDGLVSIENFMTFPLLTASERAQADVRQHIRDTKASRRSA